MIDKPYLSNINDCELQRMDDLLSTYTVIPLEIQIYLSIVCFIFFGLFHSFIYLLINSHG